MRGNKKGITLCMMQDVTFLWQDEPIQRGVDNRTVIKIIQVNQLLIDNFTTGQQFLANHPIIWPLYRSCFLPHFTLLDFTLHAESGREGEHEGKAWLFLCICDEKTSLKRNVRRKTSERHKEGCPLSAHILSLSLHCFPSCSLPLSLPVAQTTLPWQLQYMRDGALRWDDSEKRGWGSENTPVWVCMNACMHSGGGLRLVHTRPIYTIISSNVVCGLSGEIKANEMWQMKADMKTESGAPSVPQHI